MRKLTLPWNRKARTPESTTGSSETQAPARVTKVKRFNTSDKWFWIKLVGFAVWFAFVLAAIVTFVGRDLQPFFTLKSEAGVGVLLAPIAWGLWFGGIGRKSLRGMLIGHGLALAVFIPAFVLALSLATAIAGALAGVLIAATMTYRLWRIDDAPRPLTIKLNA